MSEGLSNALHQYDRETIRIMQETADRLTAVIDERDRELEVVTQERDNALLRIEELENENADQDQVIDQQRAVIRSIRHVPQVHNGPESSYRGGVHPNA